MKPEDLLLFDEAICALIGAEWDWRDRYAYELVVKALYADPSEVLRWYANTEKARRLTTGRPS